MARSAPRLAHAALVPGGNRRSNRPLLVAGSTCLLVLGVTAALLVGGWLDPRQKQVLSDVLFVLLPLPGVVFCARAARLATARLRWAWLCFTGTLAAWALGNVVWGYYQLFADHQPFPTVADAFYLAALLLAATGLALLPTRLRAGHGRPRLLLDAVSIGCSLLLLAEVLVLHEVVSAMGVGLAAAVFIAYPIADVLLATMAVLLLTRSPGRPRMDIALVATAFLAYAAADTGYALLTARGEFRIGTPVDLGWHAGYLLLGLAALAPMAPVAETRRLRAAGTTTTGALLVYSLMVTALVVRALHGRDGVFDGALAAAVLLLVGVRQVVLTRDNRELTEGLEGLVAERTTQIGRLARRHQRILESVGEGIYGVDAEGRVTFVNPAAAALLGYEPDDLIGRDAHAMFHLGSADATAQREPGSRWPVCHLAAVMDSAEVLHSAEGCYVRRGGEPFPVELTAAPLQEATDVVGAVVAFRDVTERRAVERMKDEFVSVVSHELRTPLTAIRGSLGLLAGDTLGVLPRPARRMVGIALDNSERLSRLISDILDLDRMESGQLPMELAVHDAADLLVTTMSSMAPLADASGVVLRSNPVQAHVRADGDRVVQALINLVGNAIKFASSGSEVVVEAHRDGDRVVFSVKDRGRGIPEDKLEVIFGRFRQVDSSDARELGGTGLGLAITRTIVERHGGRIRAEQRPGGGSVFRFDLPAAAPPQGALPGPLRQPAPPGLPRGEDPPALQALSTPPREGGGDDGAAREA